MNYEDIKLFIILKFYYFYFFLYFYRVILRFIYNKICLITVIIKIYINNWYNKASN
jgi:hypothetical protein